MQAVRKIILSLFLLVALQDILPAQKCTTLGQTVYSAFPVCGQSVFEQKTVPACINGTIPSIGCGTSYDDQNPYWYKFTCFSAGTLGFLITPKTLSDDYDWEIFDITGHDPADVYTDPSLIICHNWSGTTGATGTSSSATGLFECGTTNTRNPPPFSKMPALIQGHNYLLLISHFNPATQSGYDLSFQGGTAVITDPATPDIAGGYAVCDGTEIVVKLSKKMKCGSLAADGSDFSISGPVAVSPVTATGTGCATGFDMDSVLLKVNRVLSPGTYTVSSKTGTDGNTLIDNCGNLLATGLSFSLKYVAAIPTPMDSIRPVICSKDTLQLVFNKPIDCRSIAADGSDFRISGPATVTIKSASGICSNGVSTVINILLTAPIRVNGNFTITLNNGSDGNPLIDECGLTTPAGSSLSFTTKNITTADFGASVINGCRSDTVYLTHNGYGGTTQWQWWLDSVAFSRLQNPVIISKAFGPHKLQLAVNNGFCSDTTRTDFIFTDHSVKASFAAADTLCPTDTLHFTDQSTANTISWYWNFGNGITSTVQFPAAQSYPLTGRKNNYIARLMVSNQYGCSDTAYKIITILASCYIAVPSAFTPNGDGLNDYLYPLNAFKADNLVFRIYNRFGQLIFESHDWTRKWDGRVNSILQPSGTYVWILDYTNHDTGQHILQKGTTVLIR